jgi:hypothetical protein
MAVSIDIFKTFSPKSIKSSTKEPRIQIKTELKFGDKLDFTE